MDKNNTSDHIDSELAVVRLKSFLENVFKRLQHLCGILQRFDHNTFIAILHVVVKYYRSPQDGINHLVILLLLSYILQTRIQTTENSVCKSDHVNSLIHCTKDSCMRDNGHTSKIRPCCKRSTRNHKYKSPEHANDLTNEAVNNKVSSFTCLLFLLILPEYQNTESNSGIKKHIHEQNSSTFTTLYERRPIIDPNTANQHRNETDICKSRLNTSFGERGHQDGKIVLKNRHTSRKVKVPKMHVYNPQVFADALHECDTHAGELRDSNEDLLCYVLYFPSDCRLIVMIPMNHIKKQWR